MKKIIIGSVLTGIAVTAGIFLLQEYRVYQVNAAVQAAHKAYKDRKQAKYRAKTERAAECLSPMYDDLIANNINSKGSVRRLAGSKCGWITDYPEHIAYANLKAFHNFELVDLDYGSAEHERQLEWEVKYQINGYSVETDNTAD